VGIVNNKRSEAFTNILCSKIMLAILLVAGAALFCAGGHLACASLTFTGLGLMTASMILSAIKIFRNHPQIESGTAAAEDLVASLVDWSQIAQISRDDPSNPLQRGLEKAFELLHDMNHGIQERVAEQGDAFQLLQAVIHQLEADKITPESSHQASAIAALSGLQQLLNNEELSKDIDIVTKIDLQSNEGYKELSAVLNTIYNKYPMTSSEIVYALTLQGAEILLQQCEQQVIAESSFLEGMTLGLREYRKCLYKYYTAIWMLRPDRQPHKTGNLRDLLRQISTCLTEALKEFQNRKCLLDQEDLSKIPIFYTTYTLMDSIKYIMEQEKTRITEADGATTACV